MATRRRKGREVDLISAARLDLAMVEANCTNSELARVAGHASHSYVSRMRRGVGGAKAVTPLTAERIAKHLRVDIEWLFTSSQVKSVDRTAA